MATLADLPSLEGLAAPGDTSADEVLYQNVGYLEPEDAVQLNLDFPVLVPSDVPAPFGGEPAVSASPGFYSLYWMNTGGAPTFLQVTGTVGGALPAGSKNDLNNELVINATVQGNEAIQDLTVNYDAVYWIAGGVLYTVESRNMAMSSLDLANSLALYVGPDTEAPVEELPPEAGGGILEPPTNSPDLLEESTGSGEEGDVPPVGTSEELSDNGGVEPDVTLEASDLPTATEQPTEAPTTVPAQPQEGETAEPTDESQPELTSDTTGEPANGSGSESSVGASTTGSNAGSDGTGGAPLPVFGGDGTGGTRDLIVP